jgi:hypothetical protein
VLTWPTTATLAEAADSGGGGYHPASARLPIGKTANYKWNQSFQKSSETFKTLQKGSAKDLGE